MIMNNERKLVVLDNMTLINMGTKKNNKPPTIQHFYAQNSSNMGCPNNDPFLVSQNVNKTKICQIVLTGQEDKDH